MLLALLGTTVSACSGRLQGEGLQGGDGVVSTGGLGPSQLASGGLGASGGNTVGAGGALASAGGGESADPWSYFDFSVGDARGQDTGDFSPGHFKGQCGPGAAMTGLSVNTTCGMPRILQCEADLATSSPSGTVNPSCGDDRRDESTGDWDAGFRKGECGATEAIIGLARDPATGEVHDLLCAETDVVSPGACTVRNVTGGDNRGRQSSGDWDGGASQTECADGEYVKGISIGVASRRPHALLCCTGSGATSATPSFTPETIDGENACRPDGADTVVTAFDKAHLHGGQRHVYNKVTFPEKGSYEKITLTFTLGCPAAGCDPWDRWGSLGIVTRRGENPDHDQVFEVARFVTPYGVGGTFTYDVTQLRPLLKGELELRIFTDTWVDGWLATASFDMKGGKPDKEPRFVMPLWANGHVGVGNPEDPVSNRVPPKEVSVPDSVCGLGVRAIITGHGQGNSSNCAEFCPKEHFFRVADASYGRTVWRDDCATTAVPNQKGTYTYSRAGWCPGAGVRAISLDVGANVTRDQLAGKAPLQVSYDVEGYDNQCRPNNCHPETCVFDTGCEYNGGSHTQPFYSLTAVLIGYR